MNKTFNHLQLYKKTVIYKLDNYVIDYSAVLIILRGFRSAITDETG